MLYQESNTNCTSLSSFIQIAILGLCALYLRCGNFLDTTKGSDKTLKLNINVTDYTNVSSRFVHAARLCCITNIIESMLMVVCGPLYVFLTTKVRTTLFPLIKSCVRCILLCELWLPLGHIFVEIVCV